MVKFPSILGDKLHSIVIEKMEVGYGEVLDEGEETGRYALNGDVVLSLTVENMQDNTRTALIKFCEGKKPETTFETVGTSTTVHITQHVAGAHQHNPGAPDDKNKTDAVVKRLLPLFTQLITLGIISDAADLQHIRGINGGITDRVASLLQDPHTKVGGSLRQALTAKRALTESQR